MNICFVNGFVLRKHYLGLTIMWMERRYDTLYNMLENVGNSCLCKVVILRETIKVSLKLIYDGIFVYQKG